MQPDPLADLTSELERELGQIVKKKFKTDCYALYRYPLAVRPLLPDAEEQSLLNSSCDWALGSGLVHANIMLLRPVGSSSNTLLWQRMWFPST